MRSGVVGLLWLLVAAVRLAGAEVNAELTAPRTFTDGQGRSLIASVVSIDVKSVVLRRESDKKDFTFPITSLSAADQVYLAENRAALGKATAGVTVSPLVPRVVTGTEVAKAKRFAKEVLMDDRKGGGGTVFRWEKRPKFTVKATDAVLADFGRKTYEELCDAAGFAGTPDADAEITLCIGSSGEIEKLKQSLAPSANRGGTWTWHYRWSGSGYKAFVFFVPETDKETENRRKVFRGVAAVFGCPGSSDEFTESVFHSKSEADGLGPMDRQLVRLVYTQLENRAGRDKLLVAVEKNWAAMVAPPKADGKP